MSAVVQPPAAAPQNSRPPPGGLRSLFAFFRDYRASGSPLVLATVIATTGTTYRKPGAQMLIRTDDHWHGMLSGGCLEGDLAAHAREVILTGRATVIDYDLAAMTDAVWGFGLGCDGSVRILLQRLDAANDWEPFASLVHAAESGVQGSLTLLCSSSNPGVRAGMWSLESGTALASGPLHDLALPFPESSSLVVTRNLHIAAHDHTYECLQMPLPRLVRLVILGGGPDALPLVQFAAQLGWRIVVADHRPAYADLKRFPSADRVVQVPEPR